MLKRFERPIVLALFSCWIIGFGLVASYHPGPSAKHQSQQAETVAQDREASKPAAVNRAQSGESHDQQESKGEFWTAKLTDWLLAGFTFFLMLFTYRLWKSTDKLWVAGEKQIAVAHEAAEAAKLNAEALISSERAHLFIIVVNNNLFDALRGSYWYLRVRNDTTLLDHRMQPRPELEFIIKNTGRTAAIMQDISYQLIQVAAETTLFEFAVQDTIVNPVLEGGQETSPPTPCIFESALTVADGVAGIEGSRPFFFYGSITFRDTFRQQHEYRWRYQYRGNRFVLVHEEEHQIK